MADVAIDPEARDHIAKLHTRLEKAEGVLWGPDMSNGLRSIVREHEDRITVIEAADLTLSQKLQHYLEIDREQTCPTKKLVEVHLEEHSKDRKEDIAIAVAKINARGATWKEIAMLGGILLTAIGQFISTQQNAQLQKELVTIQREMPATRYPSAEGASK